MYFLQLYDKIFKIECEWLGSSNIREKCKAARATQPMLLPWASGLQLRIYHKFLHFRHFHKVSERDGSDDTNKLPLDKAINYSIFDLCVFAFHCILSPFLLTVILLS